MIFSFCFNPQIDSVVPQLVVMEIIHCYNAREEKEAHFSNVSSITPLENKAFENIDGKGENAGN